MNIEKAIIRARSEKVLVGAKHAGQYLVYTEPSYYACFALPHNLDSQQIVRKVGNGQGEASVFRRYSMDEVQASVLRPYQNLHRTFIEYAVLARQIKRGIQIYEGMISGTEHCQLKTDN